MPGVGRNSYKAAMKKAKAKTNKKKPKTPALMGSAKKKTKAKTYVGAEGSRKAKTASRATINARRAAGRGRKQGQAEASKKRKKISFNPIIKLDDRKKKRTVTTSKVGPGGRSPNSGKNTKVQAIKKNIKNTKMPSRPSARNNKRKKISTTRVYGPVKRK